MASSGPVSSSTAAATCHQALASRAREYVARVTPSAPPIVIVRESGSMKPVASATAVTAAAPASPRITARFRRPSIQSRALAVPTTAPGVESALRRTTGKFRRRAHFLPVRGEVHGAADGVGGDLHGERPAVGARAAHVVAHRAGIPRDAVVRRHRVPLPVSDAPHRRRRGNDGDAGRGRSAGTTRARRLRLLVRVAPLLLRLLSARGRPRGAAVLEWLFRAIPPRRSAGARRAVCPLRHVAPRAHAAHGAIVETGAATSLRGRDPDAGARRHRDHSLAPPARDPDRHVRARHAAPDARGSAVRPMGGGAAGGVATEPDRDPRLAAARGGSLLGVLRARASRALTNLREGFHPSPRRAKPGG